MKYAHTCYRAFDLDKAVDFNIMASVCSSSAGCRSATRDQRLRDAAGSPDQPLELTFNFGRDEPY